MRRIAIILLAVLTLAACGNEKSDSKKSAYTEGIAVGQKARDFLYADMEGKPFRLSEHKGKVVIMLFWRVKCAECVPEMDSLDALYRKFHSKGLDALAINEDSMHSAPLGQVMDLLEKKGYAFTKMRDDNGFVAEAYEVLVAPIAFVIDKNGVIVAVKSGKTNWTDAENSAFIEGLLRK